MFIQTILILYTRVNVLWDDSYRGQKPSVSLSCCTDCKACRTNIHSWTLLKQPLLHHPVILCMLNIWVFYSVIQLQITILITSSEKNMVGNLWALHNNLSRFTDFKAKRGGESMSRIQNNNVLVELLLRITYALDSFLIFFIKSKKTSVKWWKSSLWIIGVSSSKMPQQLNY